MKMTMNHLVMWHSTPSSPPYFIRKSRTHASVPRNPNLQNIIIKLVLLLNLINHRLRRLRIKHSLDVAMHAKLTEIEDASLGPFQWGSRWMRGTAFLPEVPPFVGADDE